MLHKQRSAQPQEKHRRRPGPSPGDGPFRKQVPQQPEGGQRQGDRGDIVEKARRPGVDLGEHVPGQGQQGGRRQQRPPHGAEAPVPGGQAHRPKEEGGPEQLPEQPAAPGGVGQEIAQNPAVVGPPAVEYRPQQVHGPSETPAQLLPEPVVPGEGKQPAQGQQSQKQGCKTRPLPGPARAGARQPRPLCPRLRLPVQFRVPSSRRLSRLSMVQTIFLDKMQQKKRDLLCRSVRQSRSLCSLRGRNFPPPQAVFNIR